MMTVKLTRKTGYLGMASKVWIVINEEKQEKIKNNQTKVICLPSESVKLQVTQQGVKSKEITVRPGDEVEMTTTFLGKIILPLIIFSVMIPYIFPNIDTRTIFYASIMVIFLFIIIFLFIPGAIFRLKKLQTKPW